MHTVELAPLSVPDFGLPEYIPVLPKAEYDARIAAARDGMAAAGLDFLVIYGDREHAANVAFLSGYDPRFEETLLLLGPQGRPRLLIGNEGVGYCDVSPVDFDRQLYQTFSLLGQARDRSPRLTTILRDFGIGSGAHIGTVGWKYFDTRETDTPELWLDIPTFIADTLRTLAGRPELVVNATALFMDPGTGLRATNSVDQIAQFEAVATYGSQAVRDEITNLRPGLTELQAIQLMRLNGIPLSCHTMIGSGPRARLGVMSPTDRVLKVGDAFTTCLGLQGSLTARAGFLVHGADELPAGAEDYITAVVAPYFTAMVAWWESLRLDAPAGEITGMVTSYLGRRGLGPALNPGHLLHLDEWMHSPFYVGSPYTLRSGMMLQSDIIPTPTAPYAPSNVEDGLALADEALRTALAQKHPGAWRRIEQRRQFMLETLGITLRPEVLPLSNWPCVLPPYILDSGRAMRVVA